MPSLQYGRYIIISRPHYDEKTQKWIAYASVSWSDGQFHYHQLKDFEETFQREEEAVAFGYVAGRAWIKRANNPE